MDISTSAPSITTIQPLTVTVTVGGSSGNPTPTGTVTMTCGSYSSPVTTLTGGQATIDVPAGSLAVGTDTFTVNYSGDSVYPAASETDVVVVIAPGFAVSGTAVVIAPGATTNNQSTITVSPQGGFTGSVTLTAAIGSNPPNATDPPTLSFGSTSPINIAGSAAGTATLTVATTAPATSGLNPEQQRGRWLSGGGAALACILLFIAPSRQKRWCIRLAVLTLLTSLAGGILACGGGAGSGGAGGGVVNPGTTAGAYTITVTATSGSIQQKTSVNLTVE
jgi:hypothetical protein